MTSLLMYFGVLYYMRIYVKYFAQAYLKSWLRHWKYSRREVISKASRVAKWFNSHQTTNELNSKACIQPLSFPIF
jgi:hypothetical protein